MMYVGNPYSPVIEKPAFEDVELPLRRYIVGRVADGLKIQMQGRVEDCGNCISLGLCKDADLEPNCALHISASFDEGSMVLNSLQDGQWGTEEKSGDLPLVKGKLFEILIEVSTDNYKITVNKKSLMDFKHRMPMTEARYIVVNGDGLKISFVKFHGANTLHKELKCVPTPNYDLDYLTYLTSFFKDFIKFEENLAFAPVTQEIPGGMQPHKLMYIICHVHSRPERITISLQDGESDTADILFNCAVEFEDEFSKDMVCNSFLDGKWGEEERTKSGYVLMGNTKNTIVILAAANCFLLGVREQHVVEFLHRQPMERANTVKITGDCQISSIYFQ